MSKRWLIWGILLMLFGLSVLGCSEKSEDPVGVAAPPTNSAKPSRVSSEPTSSGRNRSVGISLPERTAFYLAMQSALENSAQSNSLTLDIQYAEGQADKQVQQVDAFVQHGVDAILICPADPAKSATAIQKANTAHIPVFTTHVRTKQGNIEAHIGTDEELGGKLAAQKIAELLKDRGNIQLMEVPNDPDKDQAARAKGFEEEIGRHPLLHLLHLGEGGGRTPINAMFVVNDELASQDTTTVLGSKTTEPILIVGYGGEPRARTAIRKGQNYKADVCPDPVQLGSVAIDTIARSLRGEKTDPFVKVPPEVIDASSVDKP